jgi:hypothetical protein
MRPNRRAPGFGSLHLTNWRDSLPFFGRHCMVLTGDRDQTVIADGLTFPTAMTFGPDGALYVSHKGFGLPAGQGEILLITVPH